MKKAIRHRVLMGRDKCWAPDGQECVITILWCKKWRRLLPEWNPASSFVLALLICCGCSLAQCERSSFVQTFYTDAF